MYWSAYLRECLSKYKSALESELVFGSRYWWGY
jgi:hypothetical protein